MTMCISFVSSKSQVVTDRLSNPKQDDLGTKTIAAYLLSDGKTKKMSFESRSNRLYEMKLPFCKITLSLDPELAERS